MSGLEEKSGSKWAHLCNFMDASHCAEVHVRERSEKFSEILAFLKKSFGDLRKMQQKKEYISLLPTLTSHIPFLAVPCKRGFG